MTALRYDAVGGHVNNFLWGKPTISGRSTIVKNTTGWEILWYLSFTIDGAAVKNDCLNERGLSGLDVECFLSAAKSLSRFTPIGVSITSDFFFPTSVISQELLNIQKFSKDSGPLTFFFDDPNHRSALEGLFTAFWKGKEKLCGFDDAFDKSLWTLTLEEVTQGFRQPSVMDIKIGSCGFSPFTPEDKKKRILSRTSDLIRRSGIRICGSHRYIPETQSSSSKEEEPSSSMNISKPNNFKTVKRYKERLGKPLYYALQSEDELFCALQHFFGGCSPVGSLEGEVVVLNTLTHKETDPLPKLRAAEILYKLNELIAFFKRTGEGAFLLENMAFVSLSLLIFFESEENSLCLGNMYLIDFARCGLAHLNYSENEIRFLHGLEQLSLFLQRVTNTTLEPV